MINSNGFTMNNTKKYFKKLITLLGMWDIAKNIRYEFKAIFTKSYFLKYLPLENRLNFIKTSDPVRYGAIQLAINRIQKDNICGSFAEVGVYRGETSKIIHLLAPNKKLYLFDTFEGFSQNDLNGESDGRFKDTSVNLLKKIIGNSDNIYIKEGYFPDTTKGLENECFAFVMLDVDLYNPTLAGLQFFYPRLCSGGYIFIHDYNSPESNWAVTAAVNNFVNGIPERAVEIPDACGTIIIRKTQVVLGYEGIKPTQLTDQLNY
jgi:O-methyltransferase